jgi:MFS family permease
MSLWRHRDFLLLWGGQTISETGAAVTQLALPLTAVVALKASTFQVGLLTAATTLAFAVIALPAGALVERRPKRPIMIAADAGRMALIASIPVAWAAGVLTMAQLYAVAITTGICGVFFDVCYLSYLPGLVRTEHLMNANGKMSATVSLAELAGPGLGGGLVGAFGPAPSMAADAISFAASVAALLGIRHREARPASGAPAAPGAPAAEASRPSLRADIAEGLRFVFGHRTLRKVAACTGTANMFIAMTTAVQVIFLVRVLRVPPAYTGLVLAVSGAGGVAGGVLSGWLSRRIGPDRIIWFSILVFGAPAVLAAFAGPGRGVAWYSAGFGFLLFSAVAYDVAQLSWRQSVTPARLMGRMNAVVRWVVWGTMPLGALLGGALGTAIGVRPTLAIGLVGTWASGWWVFFSPLRRPSSSHLLADAPGIPECTQIHN